MNDTLRIILATMWVMPALAVVAAAFDLRSRTIPNWIPAAILVWGLIASTAGLLPIDLVGSLIGLAIGAVITLPLFAVRAFGGGDVKLACACCACLGGLGAVYLLTATALVGGILALIAKSKKQHTLAYAPAIAGGAIVATLILWLA